MNMHMCFGNPLTSQRGSHGFLCAQELVELTWLRHSMAFVFLMMTIRTSHRKGQGDEPYIPQCIPPRVTVPTHPMYLHVYNLFLSKRFSGRAVQFAAFETHEEGFLNRSFSLCSTNKVRLLHPSPGGTHHK